jgi:hypothetical protein
VAEISGAVRRLPKRELAKFRKWFAEFDAAAWDREFDEDVASGRLEALAREAMRDDRFGPDSRIVKHRASPRFLACIPRAATRRSTARRQELQTPGCNASVSRTWFLS